MQLYPALIIFQWGLEVKSVVVFVVAPLLSVHTLGPPMHIDLGLFRLPGGTREMKLYDK